MFDMSMVYIITAFFAVLLNNTLVETLSLGTRITFGKRALLFKFRPQENFMFILSIFTGYLVSFLTLNFVVLCEVSWEVFGVAASYNINLIAVAIVSLGCTGEP